MKIAVSGKGGSGKTTVSGTLARAFAADGYDVLAIDDDENPNLALTLGIPREREVAPIPGDLLERVQTPDGETELELAKTPGEIIDDYGVEAPDGIQLLKMGEVEHAGSGCMCRAHSTAREVLSEVVEDRDEVTVMDMVAGVEHLGRGTAKDVDTLLVVVEPYYKSLETGQRTRDLADELDIPDVRVVANKVRDDHDREAIEEFCAENGLEIATVVPYDDAIRRADQEGAAPIDQDPDAPGASAIRELADDLLETYT
ncbi:ATP-binding protein [Natrinema salifodinae]|uniref:CO dehydrogenase maturation factor n=1 Tax=Natrinema salifodinae TaxID=1202768 RepID=A0A1I0P5K7_9EURY|nr:AAA family ATPase [Natrinema salifodinae]SEW08795.1 CO dehydrogenase maturation factor [Natrinema salifodinae]